MAFAGFKKQLNKANQYMTEKMGGAEGTKLDVDFVDMERKTDVTNELVEELQLKTKEYLQPNPTARAKMAAVKGISKLSGQAKASTYPQPEGTLGECMTMYGKKLGDDSIFGQALVEMGESLKQMADAKYSLDDNTKQNFLEPLHHLQMKDLKEVMHHRKKLQGRRLDYDCKRRRQAKGSQITDDELKAAEEKFAESLHLAQMGMYNLLENDVEQVSELFVFSEGLLEYHQQCTEILKLAVETLREKREEATMRPKHEFIPKTLEELVHLEAHHEDNMNGGGSNAGSPTHHKPDHLELCADSGNARSTNASPLPSPVKQGRTPVMNKSPCCTALYDFEPENPGELGFKEGETITLMNRVDENWYEGSIHGRTGYFPVTYVSVVVPLP
uniref:Endophilin-A n=1 Tax=Cacopsylla melanoneura TaxID=428564 RepID=A0A8D9EE97_9HEMI